MTSLEEKKKRFIKLLETSRYVRIKLYTDASVLLTMRFDDYRLQVENQDEPDCYVLQDNVGEPVQIDAVSLMQTNEQTFVFSLACITDIQEVFRGEGVQIPVMSITFKEESDSDDDTICDFIFPREVVIKAGMFQMFIDETSERDKGKK